jgi:hypothetical protein
MNAKPLSSRASASQGQQSPSGQLPTGTGLQAMADSAPCSCAASPPTCWRCLLQHSPAVPSASPAIAPAAVPATITTTKSPTTARGQGLVMEEQPHQRHLPVQLPDADVCKCSGILQVNSGQLSSDLLDRRGPGRQHTVAPAPSCPYCHLTLLRLESLRARQRHTAVSEFHLPRSRRHVSSTAA